MLKESTNKYNICYHCGEECNDHDIMKDDKHFCCSGCEFVYGMLNASDIKDYYSRFGSTGLSMKNVQDADFSFLDDPVMIENLNHYNIGNQSKTTVMLPQIYCSACIWLIENLHRLHNGIIESKVNFLKKEAAIRYDNTLISLREVFELLHKVGYTPVLNLSDSNKKERDIEYKHIWRKVGIAGFTFGNLMLFALPDYLSMGELDDYFSSFLGYLNFILAFFVMYAGQDFFKSAWQGLRLNHINLDVPISLGLIVLFIRSFYEILTGTGPGYLDSTAGLVFFLLLGRVFQRKTYYNLTFDRDYKSYFPISVLRMKDNVTESVPVNNVEIGDILTLRNNEIIPMDSVLKSKNATFDYSFITGESAPVTLSKGDRIYAGAKVQGSLIEVEVAKKFHSGYLIELWNQTISEHVHQSKIGRLSDVVAKYFTIAVVLIALGGFMFWVGNDIDKAVNAFTSVLMIACPCALALSMPFSFGTAMRIFAKNNFFVKKDNVIENLAKITHIVFDKTGTLTDEKQSVVNYKGLPLSETNIALVLGVAANSTHPYSRTIAKYLTTISKSSCSNLDFTFFLETSGRGIEAKTGDNLISLGRLDWVLNSDIKNKLDFDSIYEQDIINKESTVAVSVNQQFLGVFIIKSGLREFAQDVFSKLKKAYKISIISGDSDRDRKLLEDKVGNDIPMYFNFLPDEKIKHIADIQTGEQRVLMAGDGLNDAGAMQKATVGIAVSDNLANFTPASDAIILSDAMNKLPDFLKLSKDSLRTVIYAIIISFLYNIIGFSFALQGTLSPLIAAILMPISSVSVVLFAVIKVSLHAKPLRRTPTK